MGLFERPVCSNFCAIEITFVNATLPLKFQLRVLTISVHCFGR